MFLLPSKNRVFVVSGIRRNYRKLIGPVRIFLIFILLGNFSLETLYGCAEADFNADIFTPVRGQTVIFTDASTAATSWSWNFGSGASPGTSTLEVPPNIVYTTTGAKDVSLTVKGIFGTGNTLTKSAYITVLPTPVPIAGNNGPVCVGTTLSLTASNITGATYSWTGPNGFSSSQQNPTVSASATAAMAGTYSVTATLYGYTSTAATTAVTVNGLPATPTGIAATPGTICSGSSSTISVTDPGAGFTTDWFTVSCGGTPVSGGTGVISLSVSPFTTTTYYAKTRNTTTGCISSPCASVTVTVNPNNWTAGAGTNNWNSALNWCGGVPVAGSDVLIPAGITPQPRVRNSTSAQCSSLTIDPGATLRINAGGSLTVSGNLTNSGTMTILSELTPVNTATRSGSLIVQGTSTGNVTYVRQMQDLANNGDWHFFSSPVGDQDIIAFKTATANSSNISRIWAWQETDGTWPEITSGSFVSGQGYNLSQQALSTGSFTFTGSVVNSVNITATSPYLNGYTARSNAFEYGDGNPNPIWSGTRSWANYGGGGWNLLGNPFTSAMDVTTFLTVNAGKFDPSYQALYVYDVLTDAYMYAAASAPGFPVGADFGSVIQAGQGFFVLALYDGIVFDFTSAMRVHNTSVTFAKSAGSAKSKKGEDPWPGLQLKIKHVDFETLTTIVYNDLMTAGLDPGYDVGLYSSGSEVELFTNLADGENVNSMTRQALPLAGSEEFIIPVGINSENGGEMTFSADIIPLAGCKFYLEDRPAGIFTDLSEANYTVTINPSTYGTGHFYIHTSSSLLTNVEPVSKNPEPDNLRLWVSDNTLIIKGNVGARAACEVYDMNGRKILNKTLGEGEMNSVAMPSGSKGFFIVKVRDGLNISILKAVIP